MKAIIMAGGEGTRLRPLTCDCPKPMLPLLGKPLMEYAVRLLRQHGVREIGATLGYLPDIVMDHFGSGESFGANLHWYVETSPLGTAGSVRQAKDFLDERFIVLSGDGITDFDLSRAVRFHESRNALATLVLVKSGHPQEYGMVVTDADGRVRSFHEKPGRSDVYSDRINSGIYILEPEVFKYIPEDGPCDFGHDLFPALLRAGMPVYGCTLDGYWCDVGDVSAYLRVQADALDGRIRLPGLRAEGAILEPGCFVEAPVYIASGAHICAGARIGAYSVIGEDCFVAPGASVKRSVLFDGCRIEPGAQLRGCVVGRSAVVGAGAQLFEESVAGSGSRLGARSALEPGVKLWPRKSLAEGERPRENVVWGCCQQARFVGGALPVESPAQAERAARSCVAGLQPGALLLGRGASPEADALWHAAAAGAMAQGAQVVDAGVCTLPQLRHALRTLRTGGSLLAEADRLIPLLADGSRLPERSQRALLKLYERGDFPPPFAGATRPLISVAPTDFAYVADLAASFRANPERCPALVLFCEDAQQRDLAERSFARAGLRTRIAGAKAMNATQPSVLSSMLPPLRRAVSSSEMIKATDDDTRFSGGDVAASPDANAGDQSSAERAERPLPWAGTFDAHLGSRLPGAGELGVELAICGESAILSDERGALTEVERQLAAAWTALTLGERRLVLPAHATRAIEALAKRCGAEVDYVRGERALWMAELARVSRVQFELQFDGLRFALRFLSALTERGLTLDAWRRDMPAAYRTSRSVRVPADESGRVLHALAEASPGAELGGGLRIPGDAGWAWFAPDESDAALTITAESASMETARELCDFYERELTQLLRRHQAAETSE